LTVNAVNQDPVAIGESFVVNSGSTRFFNVLLNDSDPDGDVLTLRLPEASGVAGASIVEGILRYRPSGSFEGVVRIPYEVLDGDGGVAEAVLQLTVERQDSGR